MPKGDFEKKTLNLRPGDWNYLESVYKPNGVSTSLVVRTLVSKQVDKLRQKEREQGGEPEAVKLDMNL